MTKKDPYPLPFINEVINIIEGQEIYKILDGFFNYHQILSIKKLTRNYFRNRLRCFCVGCYALWCKEWATHLSKSNHQGFL
jgi:hypothetical protein